MKVNDIVLIKDENVPRNQWSLGKVVDTQPDNQKVVRSVTLRTHGSELKRPVTKLVLLVAADDS